MRRQRRKTNLPGVYRIHDSTDDKTHVVSAQVRDPRRKETKLMFEKTIRATSDADALIQRQAMIEEAIRANPQARAARQTLGGCARNWHGLHGPTVDKGTAERYENAFDNILGDPLDKKALGHLWCDELAVDDIQRWVNESRVRCAYATVAGWLRVFKTMVRARRREFSPELCQDLDDGRVKLGEEPEVDEYAPTVEQVSAFIAHVTEHAREHLAFVYWKVVTGLRGCHLAALQFSDLDRAQMVIRPSRKVYRGRVGRITKRKPAPKQIPVTKRMLEILDEHRERLMRKNKLGPGWMFPAARRSKGTETIGPMSMDTILRVWAEGCRATGIDAEKWTPHGARGSFYDLTRGRVTSEAQRRVTAHGSERMKGEYETVQLVEARGAVEAAEAALRGKEGA